MSGDFLLYGSYGYTGRLIAERAMRQGLRPLLAGRDPRALGAQAAELGLPPRVLDLRDGRGLKDALRQVPVVLHAAGPFARTAAPMAAACLEAGTHYLDITGEIAVFEALHRLDGRARGAGVMLLPGVGFDVVPTDSLAAHLKRRLSSASRLALAIQGLGGGVSRGTATTALESLGAGGAVRRGGRIVRVPAAWRTRRVDLGRGPVSVTTIPWGDVSTAYHSTGIPDVEVYARMPAAQRRLLRWSRGLGRLLESAPVQGVLRAAVRRQPAGPSREQRESGVSLVWGEVEDPQGRRAVSRMRTPEGYEMTARTAVAAVEEVCSGRAEPGFRTPSLVFGPDWVLGIEGVERVDAE